MSRTPHRSSGPARTIVIVLTCLALVATVFSASASAGVSVGGGYDGGYPYYGDPTPGDGTATLTISEPAELRGSVVIGYEVRYAAWTLTNFTYYQGCSTSAASCSLCGSENSDANGTVAVLGVCSGGSDTP